MLISRFFSTLGRQHRLTLDEIRLVQTVAEQVVLATEQTFRVPGDRKKAIAIQVASELLLENGIEASEQVLETAIEAAVRLMNILERKVS